MRNETEIENGNEGVQAGTQRGVFSWVEMLIMTVLVVLSIVMS